MEIRCVHRIYAMSINSVDILPTAPKTTPKARRKRDVGVRRWREPAPVEFGRVHDVMRVTQVSWRFLDPGTVVWARVPYVDAEDYKVRPLIVIAASSTDVDGLACTTSLSRRRRNAQYVELQDLASAGLHRPTGVRRQPVRIPLTDIVSVLGALSDRDRGFLDTSLTVRPVIA